MRIKKCKLILIFLLFSGILTGCLNQDNDAKNSNVDVSTAKPEDKEEAGDIMEEVNKRINPILDESGDDENIIDILKVELDKMIEEGLITKYKVEENGLIILTYPDGLESGIMTKKFDSNMD